MLFQDFSGGGPTIIIEDEGPVGEPLGDAGAVAEAGPSAVIPGQAARATPRTARRDDDGPVPPASGTVLIAP